MPRSLPRYFLPFVGLPVRVHPGARARRLSLRIFVEVRRVAVEAGARVRPCDV